MSSSSSAVLAASIGAAILYIPLICSRPSRRRTLVKTASTALLSAAAGMRGGPPLLVGALAGGSLGDAFLAWDTNDGRDDTWFLCGLGSFLVAHLLYIAVFIQHQEGGLQQLRQFHFSELPGALLLQLLNNGWLAVAAAAGLAVLVPGMIASLVPRLRRMLRVPVVVYSLTIFVMALVALTVESAQLVAGALMFAASDSILAADRFLVSRTSALRPWMQHAVWLLYYPGQLLIAVGVLSLGAEL